MNSKEYVMPDGKKAVFEYDHDGIGKVTIEAMDMLMGLIADGRKRGEWVEWIDCEGEVFWKCSACEQVSEASAAGILYKFCPFCGVDMRERESE